MPLLDPYLSPQAQQAVVAGLFVAVGWWVVHWQNRRRDAANRAERVRDVQRALFAEIRAYVSALRRQDFETYGAEVARRIETESGYFPTIPTEANDAIFRAIIGEIHVLPRDTIDPLVVYYSQLSAIGAAISDLRALDPGTVQPERAAAMYRNYLASKRDAVLLGEKALLAIAANEDGTKRRPVSNPEAAGTSGPVRRP